MSESVEFRHGDVWYESRISRYENLVCPLEGCRKEYGHTRAMNQHLTYTHGLSSQRHECCTYCGEHFPTPNRNPPQPYCSEDCAVADRDYTELKRRACHACGSFMSDLQRVCPSCGAVN